GTSPGGAPGTCENDTARNVRKMRRPILMTKRGGVLCCALMFLTGFSFSGAGPVAKTHRVEIRQMKFNPSHLSVKPGDTVVFINLGMVTHDVTEATGQSWKSPPLPA